MSAGLNVEVRYANKLDGIGQVPIQIRVLQGEELLYATAVYASEKQINIPDTMKKACRYAPELESVKRQLKQYDIVLA